MKSIFSIFKRGLEKTTTKVARTIGSIFTGVKAHSAESFDELEELLIAADFGVPASLRIVGEIRDRYERGAIATTPISPGSPPKPSRTSCASVQERSIPGSPANRP